MKDMFHFTKSRFPTALFLPFLFITAWCRTCRIVFYLGDISSCGRLREGVRRGPRHPLLLTPSPLGVVGVSRLPLCSWRKLRVGSLLWHCLLEPP